MIIGTQLLDFKFYSLALHAMSLENPDPRPSLEGHMLMLVCKAKGSQDLDFSWFKEGQVIDISRTSRNMWESRIPGNDGETQSSVLNIGKAHPLDAGNYKQQFLTFLLNNFTLIYDVMKKWM